MGVDIHIVTEIRRNGEWEYVPDIPESLDVRSYGTFGLLANVRSRGRDHFPIRGIPKDVSEEGLKIIGEEGLFSHNYITLREMLDFDYTNYITDILYEIEEVTEAFCSLREELQYYHDTESSIEPNRFVQSLVIAGLGKATFIWEPEDKGEAWRTSIIKCGIEELMAIGNLYNVAAEDIRIVFSFDN